MIRNGEVGSVEAGYCRQILGRNSRSIRIEEELPVIIALEVEVISSILIGNKITEHHPGIVVVRVIRVSDAAIKGVHGHSQAGVGSAAGGIGTNWIAESGFHSID